ncbi:MAG: N-acetylmuramoyl-L-alanine amidase [Candidatus Puniceispirillum sp.]|nr:N-acetylmuramoyl-L-alanine amidase [Candidatus Puniceispirillum sp.]
MLPRSLSSPNCAPRKDGTCVRFLIIHYTACDLAETLRILTDGVGPRPVSAHYVIAEDGEIFQLVPEEMAAWHAGTSYWGAYEGLNTWSIGIELVNPGHGPRYHPFPEAQTKALLELGEDIQERHSIPAYHVLGHADIAPTRKSDPGELLDWARLASRGLGCHVPFEETPLSIDEEGCQELLRGIGYHVHVTGERDEQTTAALRAFAYRCAPRCIHDPWDGRVMATLSSYHARVHEGL